jgi:hypothetical protein
MPIVYGWVEDYSDRILPLMVRQFGISCFTEGPYCGGSIIYGIVCDIDDITGAARISRKSERKVMDAYLYYNEKYREINDRCYELWYLQAEHSDSLETVYRYEE